MANRRNNKLDNFIKNLKDYIVPIIGFLLILFIIYFFFFSDGKKENNKKENKNGISITLNGNNTKAKIHYSGGKDSEVTNDNLLYKGEKIIVSEGRVKIKNSDNYSFNIDERGELSYVGDSNFSILNGNIWLDTNQDMNIKMKYGEIKVSKDSHVSFSQNEVSSTIYLISGIAEVSNNKGKTTTLTAKEKIEIPKKKATSSEIDLNVKKEELDNFFKSSSWFTINNGPDYLKDKKIKEDEEKTEKLITNDNISFGNLIDESNVSNSSINIYGTYSGDDIEKIVVNNENIAKLNKENKSFNFDSVDVSKKTNDLVFKIYDSSNELTEKIVYTVYYDGGKSHKNNNQGIKSNPFSVDGSKFSFTAPNSKNIYTTYENIVTIKGKVVAKNVTKITVNGYQLKSFNGSSWMYHARKDFGNLVDGTNEYEIKYFNGDDLMYRNYYTIVKKIGTAPETSSSGSTE